jgi:hypothetical protein
MTMIFIPIWIPNVLFLLSCVMSAYQHWRLNKENPVATLQFGIILFSMVMILAAVLYSRSHRDPWISMVFFLAAV